MSFLFFPDVCDAAIKAELFVKSGYSLKMFAKINSSSYVRETVSVSRLDIGKKYKVEKVKRVVTKYGEKILVDTEEFNIWLPDRFSTLLSDEDIGKINKNLLEGGKLFLQSMGAVGRTFNIVFLEE